MTALLQHPQGGLTMMAERKPGQLVFASVRRRKVTASFDEIRDILARATIVEHHDATQVSVGGSVLVRDDSGRERTYSIVGSAEIDPAAGKISNETPAARALLGAKAGETVNYKAPGRTVALEVLKVW